jgi:hypothetical protein
MPHLGDLLDQVQERGGIGVGENVLLAPGSENNFGRAPIRVRIMRYASSGQLQPVEAESDFGRREDGDFGFRNKLGNTAD